MYSWIDVRKFSSSRTLPSFSLTSRYFNPFIRNGFELNNFSHLPVIKEEDGCISEDEIELCQELLQNSVKKKNGRKNLSYLSDPSFQKIRDPKCATKLPPLVNINCLMNTEIKHTQAVWNTNFGKRLIQGKNFNENLDLSDVTNVFSNDNSKNDKAGDCKSRKSLTERKCLQGTNIKSNGDKIDYWQPKNNRKKPKKIKKNNQNATTKQLSQGVNCVENNSQSQTAEKFFEITPKESLQEVPTVSSFSKKQRFLTECVKSILDCYSTQIVCEYCKETLQNIEEFKVHKKQHEAEKEICLLCDKVFYNSNKFIKHLLTHEGVDRFSCKKCKKYFPSLKKYKQHCQNFHVTQPESITSKGSQSMKFVEKWLPKYECRRCKMEFDSEKAQEDHRREHIRKDLVGAYLLTPKNI